MMLLVLAAVIAGPSPAAATPRVLESEMIGLVPVTPDDYPPASLRAEETGRVTYAITVGIDGVARDCEVIGSSNFPRLDERSCVVAVRAKYRPATLDGKVIASRRTQSINWIIPVSDQPLPAPARGAIPGD